MSDCVQFVVCQHTGNNKKYLFYAPAYSCINIGDEVLVDTQFGEKKATVLAVCDTASNDVIRTLRVLTGTEDKPINRVIGKYHLLKLEYSEDENNE